MKHFFWLARVCLVWCCLVTPALAQEFAFGASVSGVGNFGTDLFGIGLPGTLGASVRVEWLNGFAKGFALRTDLGTRGLEAGLVWRLDLSQVVNATIQIGFALLEWQQTGLVGRFGFEYHFGNFAVALEYGWLSPFFGTPNLRSSLLLSFLWMPALK